MPDPRTLHPVSTKAILFSPDRREVLVMKYLWENVHNTYGLPGGHLEQNESPDQAVLREVQEELGIVVDNLQREDFLLHESGKVVLIYSGTLDKNVILISNQPEGEIGLWITIQDIENGVVSVGSYKGVVLQAAKRGFV